MNVLDIVLVLRCPGTLNSLFQALAKSKPIATGDLAKQKSDKEGDMGDKVRRERGRSNLE